MAARKTAKTPDPKYPLLTPNKRPAALGNPNAKVFTKFDTFPRDRKGVRGPARVRLVCTEFTCRCPITGQPDYATLTIDYCPRALCLETKSLKLYLETFRERGIFHEHVAAVIRRDIQKVLGAATMTVTAKFNTRGGIAVEAAVVG